MAIMEEMVKAFTRAGHTSLAERAGVDQAAERLIRSMRSESGACKSEDVTAMVEMCTRCLEVALT